MFFIKLISLNKDYVRGGEEFGSYIFELVAIFKENCHTLILCGARGASVCQPK